jgi:hypothetical protein
MLVPLVGIREKALNQEQGFGGLDVMILRDGGLLKSIMGSLAHATPAGPRVSGVSEGVTKTNSHLIVVAEGKEESAGEYLSCDYVMWSI